MAMMAMREGVCLPSDMDLMGFYSDLMGFYSDLMGFIVI